MSAPMQWLRDNARRLKRETVALYFAARDPATPWHAKAFVGLIVAYALSPIDLIPDFIPILGYLDEIVLLPLALAFAIRLIPAPVMRAARERAAQEESRPISRVGAAVIVTIWLAAIGLSAWAFRDVW
jgi:uncharacterized membrane protein YkvA (DUF1232 family)